MPPKVSVPSGSIHGLDDLGSLRHIVKLASPLCPSAGQRRHGVHGGLRQAPGVVADAGAGRGALPPRLLRPAGHPGLQLLHPVSPGRARRHPQPGEARTPDTLAKLLTAAFHPGFKSNSSERLKYRKSDRVSISCEQANQTVATSRNTT